MRTEAIRVALADAMFHFQSEQKKCAHESIWESIGNVKKCRDCGASRYCGKSWQMAADDDYLAMLIFLGYAKGDRDGIDGRMSGEFI